MARARRRLEATDNLRYPNFEGVGPDITGMPQSSVEPGSRRGNIGIGALGGAVITRGPSRLESMKGLKKIKVKGQGNQGNPGQGRGRGAPDASFSPEVGGGIGQIRRNTPVQGPGSLKPGTGRKPKAANQGRAGGRGVRG